MKIRHLSFCLTIMAAAACSPVERNITWFGSDEKDAKELTDKAIVSLGEGNVEQAILQAEEALRKVPKYPYALMVAGVGYGEQLSGKLLYKLCFTNTRGADKYK